MSSMVFPEIRVSLDIGCRLHSVAVGLADGQLLDEFEIEHTKAGFELFFNKIRHHEVQHKLPVSIAMEGYNGYARPLDHMIRVRDYRLFNINNLKLARFKEIFPGAAKSDAIDARKGLELFQLRDHLPMARDVLQEIAPTPIENDQLKRLTRRRRRMVNERVSVMNSLQTDLQAVCPGLCDITGDVSQVWYLNFLSSAKSNLTELSRKRLDSLLKIKRFAAETSLALYLGMATLDKSSGTFHGSKVPKHVNTRAKAAMMVAVDHHRRNVEESKRYYEKKRAEGKKHNQATRALGRHLCRVIFKMLRDGKTYEQR